MNAPLPKFSETLTLSQSKGADYAHPLALLGLKNSVIMPLLQFKLKIENLYLVRDINSPIPYSQICDFFIKIFIVFSGLKSSNFFKIHITAS